MMARTRSSKVHEKVLHAALELIGERGIDATSMDAIAQAAGVSKATVYNHWADKEALLMEVMLFVHGLDREPEPVSSGDICSDLVKVIGRHPPGNLEAARNRIMPALIAYSAVHQEFGKAWRHRVMDPPRKIIRHILRRGIEEGLLRSELDMDLAIALLMGPMLYSRIFAGEVRVPSSALAPAVVEAFWRAHAASPAVPSQPSGSPRIQPRTTSTSSSKR